MSAFDPEYDVSPERTRREAELSRLLRICGHRLYHTSPSGRTQSAALQMLRESGPMSQKDLQTRLMIQSGSASELLTKLEQKGLLVRTRDSADRRKVLLTLTEEGVARSNHMAQSARIPARYRELSDDEAATLCALLEKVILGWKEDGVPEGELGVPGAAK